MMMMMITCMMNGMACYQSTFSFRFPSLSAFSPEESPPDAILYRTIYHSKLTTPEGRIDVSILTIIFHPIPRIHRIPTSR